MLVQSTLANDSSGSDYRDDIVSFLRRQLVGPLQSANEILAESPRLRFLLGILFPRRAMRRLALDDEQTEGDNVADEETALDAPIIVEDDWLPSSLGLSFYTTSTSIDCAIWGARYEERAAGRGRKWHRLSISEESDPEKLRISPFVTGATALDGRAELSSVWRPLASGYLITVTLSNATTVEEVEGAEESIEMRRLQDAGCLHQIGLACTPFDSAIEQYPSISRSARDDEDEELNLMYSHAATYGVGHGCSIKWTGESHGKVSTVRSEHLPMFDIAPVDYELSGFDDVLTLRNLVSYDSSRLFERLGDFVSVYESWQADLALQGVNAQFEDAKRRILARAAEASSRMHSGIRYLKTNANALSAFRAANKAMLVQMLCAEQIADASYERSAASQPILDWHRSERKWRPFQLAFQLLTLRSTGEVEDAEREIVDLIWFPTGGGKTEAYLALAAFVLIFRRLCNGLRGAGTTVITRYTLSLLTAQQFQRAAALICALEWMRVNDPIDLGQSSFTIGLWIGGDHTPNLFTKAREAFEAMLEEEEPRNPFQLQQCPWCGTQIVPKNRSDDPADYGIRSTDRSFQFFCPADDCAFHDGLPVGVIDEALYAEPPSLLLATVDKFAQLPWDDRAGVFFGAGRFDTPSLIIQDELHLLSGPLGTTVGLYETAIEALIALNGGRPKVVASTATIRGSTEQILGLFGRKQTRLFPPSGLDSRDSFYARASDKPGRRYLGILPQSHSTQTAVVNAASAILQSPIACSLGAAQLDAMWTLVVYHNSLRELGRTINLSRDDIPERLAAWYGDDARVIADDQIMELRSRLDGAVLPKRLQQLKVGNAEEGALSIVGCTNMFSVGVDVQRLGVMLVNGQPKSTSEYIQATSRVGRGAAAGLVVILYGATRPRDRSHYEQFVAFHSSLYKRVEPTSVTPFSPPARSRALHTVLVTLMRHWGGLPGDDEAGNFTKDSSAVATIRAIVASRVRDVDSNEAEATMFEFDRLVEAWDSLAASTTAKKRPLFYRSAGMAHRNLLARFGSKPIGMWPTPTSMRNVDVECGLGVLGAERR